MRRPNKIKKDPITEWAVGQPLVMQTKLEQETTTRAILVPAPLVSRIKKTLPAKHSSGRPKKAAVSRARLRNKKTSA
jgi:hypothetical protein